MTLKLIFWIIFFVFLLKFCASMLHDVASVSFSRFTNLQLVLKWFAISTLNIISFSARNNRIECQKSDVSKYFLR